MAQKVSQENDGAAVPVVYREDQAQPRASEKAPSGVEQREEAEAVCRPRAEVYGAHQGAQSKTLGEANSSVNRQIFAQDSQQPQSSEAPMAAGNDRTKTGATDAQTNE